MPERPSPAPRRHAPDFPMSSGASLLVGTAIGICRGDYIRELVGLKRKCGGANFFHLWGGGGFDLSRKARASGAWRWWLALTMANRAAAAALPDPRLFDDRRRQA